MSSTHQTADSYQQSTHSNCPPPQQVAVNNGSNMWWNDFEVNHITESNPTGRLVTPAGSAPPQYQRPAVPNRNIHIDQMDLGGNAPQVCHVSQPNGNQRIINQSYGGNGPQVRHDGQSNGVSDDNWHNPHVAPPSYPGSPALSAPPPPSALTDPTLTVSNRKRKPAASQIAPPITPSADSTATPSAGRKGNFTEDEDIQLCQSWLTVSQDSVIGNGQTRDAMWERITTDFQTHMKEFMAKKKTHELYVERQLGSLQARWGPLNKAVNKYVGDLAKCQNFHGSGKSAVDIAADAHQMYFEREKQPFKFVRCHAFLSTAPKWHDYNTARSSAPTRCASVISIRSTPAHTDNDSDIEIMNSDDRPMGNKAAKRARQVDSYLAQLAENTRSIAQSSASMALDSRVQSSAVDFLTDDVVLKTDTSTLKGAIKSYYEKKQAEILKKQEGKLGAAEQD